MNWQLIETAPNAGEVILFGVLLTYCCSPDDRGKPMGKAVVAVGSKRLGRWWSGLYECLPTHWMPLPDPPEVKKARKRGSEEAMKR